MTSRASLVAAIASLCVLSSVPAAAQSGPVKPWVKVIDIRSPDAPALAASVTAAMKRELGRPPEAGFQLDNLLRDLSCGAVPDTACLTRISGRVDADQFVWGFARRAAPGQVAFELHMYSRGEPERYTELLVSDTLADPFNPALQRQVQSALAILITRGGSATVRLHVGNVDGQVLVDGHPATDLRDGKVTLSLRAGEHTIEIRSASYSVPARKIFLQPAAIADVELEPTPLPGTEQASPSTPVNWHKNLGWTAIGAGALFAGLGYWSTTKVSDADNDPALVSYRNNMATNVDVCDAARADTRTTVNGASPSDVVDACDRGSKYSTMQWVFYGTALVSLTTGIYLVATDPGPRRAQPAARFQLLPSVGKTGGTLGARFSF
ncbi:MAG: hypothetical protein HY898_19760 [Deltaproteobacteria bacterium]|nr:hypothetical protein [Deltaproteobacteria bacterium]